uniref:Uncharacterized protein n=1 Tax=Mycena chlorophos TaxID=658473 RepID=A0ABQ0MD36_MYCCL|nr:predicted protein [Mycena chlorophos]
MSTLAAAACPYPCKHYTRDAAYSLFGGPLILNVGPTINGEFIRVRIQPINTVSVIALAISLLLFIAFMCFYLYPLYRQRRERKRAAVAPVKHASPDLEPGCSSEADKKSLMSWLYSRSRDRFSTHDSSTGSPKEKMPYRPQPPSLRFQQSTTRGSLVPDLSSPTLTPPPPAYASRPSSPLAAEFRFPSTNGPSTTSNSNSPTAPIPAHIRTVSTTLRPFPVERSVSASTLHPSDAHRPSRARVYSEGASNVRRVPHSDESSNSSIGLAARGRQLTAGPSFASTGRGGGPFSV